MPQAPRTSTPTEVLAGLVDRVTKSAIAAERTLLRRVPNAERGAPTPEVVEAVAAVKRY